MTDGEFSQNIKNYFTNLKFLKLPNQRLSIMSTTKENHQNSLK